MISIVEPKLRPFKMQIKSRFRKSRELWQTHFSNAPEVFDSVNMELVVFKFVVCMLSPMIFFITKVNQTIIAFTLIRVEGALKKKSILWPRITSFSFALERLGAIFA